MGIYKLRLSVALSAYGLGRPPPFPPCWRGHPLSQSSVDHLQHLAVGQGDGMCGPAGCHAQSMGTGCHRESLYIPIVYTTEG